MKPIRIAIVEDDRDLLEGIRRTLAVKEEIELVGTFSSAEEYMEQVEDVKPQITLMDIGLPRKSGIECMQILKPRFPDLQFLMWTTFEDDEKIFDALKAGANGYILKTAPTDQLVKAIFDLNKGDAPMSSSIARKVIASFHNADIKQAEFNLTKRESEILELLSRGYRYKEIADKLCVSIETVRSHVHHIYEKLQVSSRTDALNKVYGK